MKKRILFFILSALIISAVFTFSGAAQSDDPADSYTHINASSEVSSVSMWFDYATEKVPKSAEATGMETFSVYMAGNEIEGCQAVIKSDCDISGLTAVLTPFTNKAGDTLEADIYYELYQDCDSYGEVPDAIPPLSAYGAFSLKAGEAQPLLIKIKTAENTVAGWYEGAVTVKNSAGDDIKYAKVYAYVWDFALSEKTECATSINLDMGYLQKFYPNDTAKTIYKNYYNYMLENRVCAYYLPENPYSKNATAYMDNPRVTSFQMRTTAGADLSTSLIKTVYENQFTDHPDRFNKSYFFSNVVDAATAADLERLKAYYDNLYSELIDIKPDYADEPFWMINTYINDIDYQSETGLIDQIEYYKSFVNHWCSKTFAYTDKSELDVTGAKLMQGVKWDSVYGTFSQRMAERKAAGQKVWWFISWDVDAPYINYFIQTDGTAQRVLFWQQYDNGVEGFLYNFANYWFVEGGNPYTANLTNTSMTEAHGESILIYPGSEYGLKTPVGSLRFEAMRDGIEDYQMFAMLESYGVCADSIIDIMTTGMVHYSVDDSAYYNARKALGNAVCRAEKAAGCTHTYESEVITPASCTAKGEIRYTCSLCQNAYTEETDALGHNYVNGVCSRCGEKDPDAPSYTAGDINGDGKINATDCNLLKRVILGKETQNGACDINSDGKVNTTDVACLLKMLIG